MRLDTISRIEQFMTDALLSSTLIPLGVNVIRLAATEDEEGIAVMARTIVVRYTGSSISVTNLSPLATERVMNFEVTLAAQSYLTQSGHDYVTQMCAGSYNTLNNQVPMDCGVEVIEPLHLSSEQFQGLTDNSQYVYVQTWQLTAQEINSVFAMDPCVQRGNCSYLFPDEKLQTVLPGDVLYSNLLYAPVLPPPPGLDYDPEFCGVEVSGNDLVYKTDTNVVFLRDWELYNLVSTGTFDTTGKLLVVNIYEKETNKLVDNYMASNCGGRGLIQIGGNQPARNANYIGGLYMSPIDQAGNPSSASKAEVLTPVFAQKNGYGFVNVIRATVYTDPTVEGTATATVKYGQLYTYQEGVELVSGNQTYLYIGGTPIGKAWIKAIDFRVVKYDPGENCVGPDIGPGVPEGADKDKTGPIESCE
jgi:hypothetical protein